MKVISSTDLRKNLSKMMDKVNDDHAPLIVTRTGGKPVVVISLEDYEAMDETTYLMSTDANRKQLLDAIERLKNGEGIERELIEP